MPDRASATDLLPNPHPGEILLEDFLKPMGLSPKALARDLQLSPQSIHDIICGKHVVTPYIDKCFSLYFGVSAGFFLGLQADYDLVKLRRLKIEDALNY